MNKSIEPKVFAPGWGARLTQARKFLKKTQADIGQLIGVRNTAVSKWEGEIVEVDERSLKALEFTLGINPDWVRQGDPPMIATTWNEEMRRPLIGLAGKPVDGVWEVPEGTGMEPIIHPGEVLHWIKVDQGKLVKGALYLVIPKGSKFSGGRTAPKDAKIGAARPVEGRADEWLLYRAEDRTVEGSYPPIALRDVEIIGQAVLATRRLPGIM